MGKPVLSRLYVLKVTAYARVYVLRTRYWLVDFERWNARLHGLL